MENIANNMMKQPFLYQNNRNDYRNINAPSNEMIGICYVPMQEWEQVYDEDTAFSVGTLFPALNKPFLGGGK